MPIEPSDVLLDGRVAVVTGAGSGIGRGIAAGFAAFGASVAIWEQDPKTCAAAAEQIGALGVPTDVRDSEAVDAALARTAEALGPVSILVNNASGWRKDTFSPVVTISCADTTTCSPAIPRCRSCWSTPEVAR